MEDSKIELTSPDVAPVTIESCDLLKESVQLSVCRPEAKTRNRSMEETTDDGETAEIVAALAQGKGHFTQTLGVEKAIVVVGFSDDGADGVGKEVEETVQDVVEERARVKEIVWCWEGCWIDLETREEAERVDEGKVTGDLISRDFGVDQEFSPTGKVELLGEEEVVSKEGRALGQEVFSLEEFATKSEEFVDAALLRVDEDVDLLTQKTVLKVDGSDLDPAHQHSEDCAFDDVLGMWVEVGVFVDVEDALGHLIEDVEWFKVLVAEAQIATGHLVKQLE